MLKKIIGPKVGFATTSGLKKQISHAHLKLGNYKTGQRQDREKSACVCQVCVQLKESVPLLAVKGSGTSDVVQIFCS